MVLIEGSTYIIQYMRILNQHLVRSVGKPRVWREIKDNYLITNHFDIRIINH